MARKLLLLKNGIAGFFGNNKNLKQWRHFTRKLLLKYNSVLGFMNLSKLDVKMNKKSSSVKKSPL